MLPERCNAYAQQKFETYRGPPALSSVKFEIICEQRRPGR
jgi:hypothetical protein